jgi:hypothetical protein
MKLSDAIALGRTLCKSVPYEQDDLQGGGCALGMAARAMDTHVVGRFWIGITNGGSAAVFLGKPAEYPCGCKWHTSLMVRDDTHNKAYRIVGLALIHVFNEHVHGDHTWTLDQLIDWVREQEAKYEPEGAKTEVCSDAISVGA